MGVEIKQTLERDYNINMKASEIRLLTLNTLKTLGPSSDEGETTKETKSQQNSSQTPHDKSAGMS